jgi:hypothetical protein
VNVYKMSDSGIITLKKYEMVRNIESDKCRNRNDRDEGMNKLLGELSIEGLTADCFQKKIRRCKQSTVSNRIRL